MLPLCCCPKCCTHRRYSDVPEVTWSKNVWTSGHCAVEVRDIAVDADGTVYVLAARTFEGQGSVVQRWTSAGVREWTVEPSDANLKTIAVNGDAVYVGGYKDLFSDVENLLALDKSDGSELWAVEAGQGNGSQLEVNDLLARDGVLYVATMQAVERYNTADGTSAGDPYEVGAGETQPRGRVWSIAMDGDGNLYTAGYLWGGDFCQSLGTVAKFAPDRSLTWLWRNRYLAEGVGVEFAESKAVAWQNGSLFVAHSQPPSQNYCNLERWNPDNARFVWGRRLEFSAENMNTLPIVALAADDDSVWAAAGPHLWQWGHSGSLAAVSPNSGTVNGKVKTGDYLAVAAFGDGGAVAGGKAAACTVEDTEDETDHECDCDALCEPVCGQVGPFGGTLVNCDWDEVPCEHVFPIDAPGCEAIDGGEVRWRRDNDDPLKWHGPIYDSDGIDTGEYFDAEYDCESEVNGGWSLTASAGITDNAILSWWCADDAPAGNSFPGFAGTFTWLADGCSEVCVTFGGACPPAGIDACGCTGVPTTLHATITVTSGSCANVDGDTAVLTNSGGTVWSGTASTGCTPDIGITLTCSGGSWSMDLTPGECFLTAGGGTTGTCSPFQQSRAFTWINSGSCTCCATATQITVTVTV